MNFVISAIVGVLILLGAVVLSKNFYHQVKNGTVVKVHRGLSPLEGFTQKLTGQKLKF